jgi:5-methyltetrahydropteroyltriglutamate--homocysteine methyltransferase
MRDLVKYPEYLDYLRRTAFAADSVSLGQPPQATGPIAYGDTSAIDAECVELADALRAVGRTPADAFVSAPSPGIVVAAMDNRHYPDLDAYLDAVSGACSGIPGNLRHGLRLQIDAPDRHGRRTYFADQPSGFRQVRRTCGMRSTALKGVERGGSVYTLLELVKVHDGSAARGHLGCTAHRCRPLVLSMANPRHAHEYICSKRGDYPRKRRLLRASSIRLRTTRTPRYGADRLCRLPPPLAIRNV